MALERAERRDEGAAEAAAPAAREPSSAAFAEILFGRVPPEDLRTIPAGALADLAASAYRHLSAPRSPAAPDLRLDDVEIERGGRGREVTVVEIVNDNMPFLLDSTLAELVEQGYEPLLVAHPILAVERDGEGRLVRLGGEATAAPPPGFRRESFIHIHLERIDDAGARERLLAGLGRVYADVAVAVRDWVAMRSRVRHLIETYRIDPPPLDPAEVKEALAFLDWMVADNFTFLGVREYRFVEGRAADTVEGSGLGLLRDPSVRVLRRRGELVVMTHEIRAFLERPQALIISKANVKSRVHRRVYLDYVGVKLFSAEGRLEGELRLIGLFTASAYTSTTAEVPYLRRKVAAVVARAGFDPASHAGRALLNVLESYPRDELFQLSDDDLYRFVLEIMNLAERPRIRALPRRDEFDRFVSVLVYVPKDRYDTTARRRIGDFLAGIYGGRNSASYPAYPEGPLARIHYIIGRDEGGTPAVGQEPWRRGSPRSCGPGATACATPSPNGSAAPGRGRSGAATRTRSAARTAKPSGRRPPCGIWTSWKSSRTLAPARSTSTAARATRPAASTSRSSRAEPRCRSPSGCRSWRTWASASSTSGPTASSLRAPARPSASGCTT
jgi:glutamate dehydrogenase